MVNLFELCIISRAQCPTVHEIIALGIKRIRDMGKNPQQLAGHDDIRWVNVQSPLGYPAHKNFFDII